MSEPQEWEEVPDDAAELTQNKGRVMINLDTEVREDTYEQFGFVLAGRRIAMIDPADIDWQEIDGFSSELDVIDASMTAADLKFFKSQKLPGWKMRNLVSKYQKHYGITEDLK